jgi:hypothetical protein
LRWSHEQLAYRDLFWFRPIFEINSPTSSRMILMKTSITMGEQSAQEVHVLKEV